MTDIATTTYDAMRHFADSWGLVYMLAIFLAVAAMLVLPGAARRARDAARIPLADDTVLNEERRK
jgi:cytochrome c oxidase cbb3-type subunit 4